MQIAFNRTKRTDKIKYIIIHDTGNIKLGANARSHFNYFNGGNRGSSADFFVDDKLILKVNDYNKYYTWHCGDGKGKSKITLNNSIGIEMCINVDGNYNKAFENTIEVTKKLMTQLNIPLDRVVRHYDVSGKNCPQTFNGGNWERWKEFKSRLEETEVIYNWTIEVPEWGRPTVQKLLDKGYLKGDDAGALNISETMLRILVINDRAGIYDLK